MKCLALSRYPRSDPLLGTALTTAKLAEGWLSVFWQKKKKKDFNATIECGKIGKKKPRYTVNKVPLTKNSLRAPLVARNNSSLSLHWRRTLCGSKKKKKHKVSHFYFSLWQKMEDIIGTYFVHFYTFSYIFKAQRTPTEFGPPLKPQGDFFCFVLLRCFDTVFQRPYRYFSITFKVFFPLPISIKFSPVIGYGLKFVKM